MRAQADRFLVHGDLVGIDGSLGQDARFVDGRALQDLLHARGQLFAVLAHRFGRALLDHARERFDGRESAADVLGQLLPLRRAHLVIGRERLVEHLADVRADGSKVFLRLCDAQHVGDAGEVRHVGLLFQIISAVKLVELPQRVKIAARKPLVDRNDLLVRAGRIDADEHIDFSAGNCLLHTALDGVLGKNVGARQLYRAVEVAVVHAAYLNGDVAIG